MNYEQILNSLISFCIEYREHANEKRQVAYKANNYLDAQYYIGRFHAVIDILRELDRLKVANDRGEHERD